MPEKILSISETCEYITHLPEQFERETEVIAVTRDGKPILAVLPWELYESLMETLEVMSDEELMAAFREGVKDMEEGRTESLDDVLKELGWE